MNLGPLIVLFKFLKDAGGLSPTLVGPPAPDDKVIPTNVSIRPLCGPGYYAFKSPTTNLWSCLLIPKGR